MPRIRFTATPKLPRDLAHLAYQAGQEVDLPQDQADRWLRRGVATLAPAAAPARQAAPAAAPLALVPAGLVEIPQDWQDQHHMTRMALARRLTTDEVTTLEQADALITAEAERRAALTA